MVTTRPLGRSGADIAVIGQGTWEMPTRGRRVDEGVAALVLGVELGLTHVDTAEMYGDGAVETMVARAIAGRRQRVFLASKVLPVNASYAGTISACERSLRRLGTDRLDLYMLHWPGRHPIAETMAAMEHLADAGKIRFIGVSNFDVEDLAAARRALTRHRIVATQVLYHLGDRGMEHRVLPYCAKAGITVVGYSPFGSGRFPTPRSRGGRALAAVAARHGASPHQVALAFLARDPGVVVIPKAAAREHVRENAGAANVRLSEADCAAIDAAFPLPPAGGPLGVL